MKRGQETSNDDSAAPKRQRSSIENACDGRDGTPNDTPESQVRHQTKNALCSRCARLDFDRRSFPMKRAGYELRLLNLGTLGPETEFSSCSMCRLFNAVKFDEHADATEYALYLTGPPTPYDSRDGLVLAVAKVRHKHLRQKHFRLSIPQDSSRYIALTKTSAQLCHRILLPARRIRANKIDFSMVHRWLDWCNEDHAKQCNVPASLSGPSDLRLIDCKQRIVLQLPPSHRYCALSYVWGRQSQKSEQVTDGRLPGVLPRTIEDAITVTQELGIRYIWIDRYCIDQKNVQEKHTQIQQMDLIYRHAYLTIIAAAGDDPSFGLPGVSTMRTCSQSSARIDDHHLVSVLPHPRALVKTSPWASRAWVYQECYFSRRRLAFTEQEIYYECRGGSAQESIDRVYRSTNFNLFSTANNDEKRPWAISTHLGQYCGRALSYEEDAIRAFEGVFHDFRNRKHAVHHYLGIPIVPSVIAGPKSGLKISDRSKSEGFAAGLCWRHSGQGVRRFQLPTWSWAGWTVPVTGFIPECADGFKTTSSESPRVFVESPDGALVDFEAYDDFSLTKIMLESYSNFIHLEAWTIPLDLQYLPGRSAAAEAWIYRFRKAVDSENISAYFAVFEDETAILRIPTYSLYQAYSDGSKRQDFSPNSAQGEVLGVVLGRSTAPIEFEAGESIFIMIVQDRGGYFERVGHMEFNSWTGRATIKSTDEEIEWWVLRERFPKLGRILYGGELVFRSKKWRRIRLG